MREFTLQQLNQFDGRDGAPAYVALNGFVYDVSASWHWKDGWHWGFHDAGRDLTLEIAEAPHGAEMLERFPIVGHLVTEPRTK